MKVNSLGLHTYVFLKQKNDLRHKTHDLLKEITGLGCQIIDFLNKVNSLGLQTSILLEDGNGLGNKTHDV